MRIAIKYRTPVILLTDGYLANGAEPWVLPDVDALPDISVPFATEPNHGDEFWPYLRDPETLARPWAIPGTPGLMHRIGGIEKEDGTGNISYDPANHEHDDAPARRRRSPASPTTSRSSSVDDPDGADLLVLVVGRHVGRDHRGDRAGSGPGARRSPTRTCVHLNPFPRDLGDVLARYPKVLVPELNLGQLVEAGAGRVPGRRADATPRSPACPSAPPRSRTRSWR